MTTTADPQRTPGTFAGVTHAVPAIPPLVDIGPSLDAAQRTRYARHLLMPMIGEEGQRRLLNARVAVVGAGGLGSPALLYLSAAGVGRVTVIDDDSVDLTNLQRQVIHDASDVGLAKVDSAVARVRELNPDCRITGMRARLTAETARDLLAGHDLVLDGSDNFPTRYVVNDVCAELGLPFIWAAVYRTQAQVALFWKEPTVPGVTGVDLRDLFPIPPDPTDAPACGDAGVLGPLVGQVGSLMATEALKLLTGTGESLLGRVLYLDSLTFTTALIPLRPRSAEPPARTRSRSVPLPMIGPRELAAWLGLPGTNGAVPPERPTPFVLDVREPQEVAMGRVPGAHPRPLGDLQDDPTSHEDLPRDRDIVIYCKAGPRAVAAATALRDRGLTNLYLLDGGILGWIDQIDPTIPRY